MIATLWAWSAIVTLALTATVCTNRASYAATVIPAFEPGTDFRGHLLIRYVQYLLTAAWCAILVIAGAIIILL